jgi:hypothetical protein
MSEGPPRKKKMGTLIWGMMEEVWPGSRLPELKMP